MPASIRVLQQDARELVNRVQAQSDVASLDASQLKALDRALAGGEIQTVLEIVRGLPNEVLREPRVAGALGRLLSDLRDGREKEEEGPLPLPPVRSPQGAQASGAGSDVASERGSLIPAKNAIVTALPDLDLTLKKPGWLTRFCDKFRAFFQGVDFVRSDIQDVRNLARSFAFSHPNEVVDFFDKRSEAESSTLFGDLLQLLYDVNPWLVEDEERAKELAAELLLNILNDVTFVARDRQSYAMRERKAALLGQDAAMPEAYRGVLANVITQVLQPGDALALDERAMQEASRSVVAEFSSELMRDHKLWMTAQVEITPPDAAPRKMQVNACQQFIDDVARLDVHWSSPVEDAWLGRREGINLRAADDTPEKVMASVQQLKVLCGHDPQKAMAVSQVANQTALNLAIQALQLKQGVLWQGRPMLVNLADVEKSVTLEVRGDEIHFRAELSGGVRGLRDLESAEDFALDPGAMQAAFVVLGRVSSADGGDTWQPCIDDVRYSLQAVDG